MHHRVRLAVAAAVATTGLTGVTGIGASLAASAFNAAEPSCSTVSPSVVKAALGGSPSTPGTSTGTSSLNGFKTTSLTCTYSSTLKIIYSTPATVTAYNKSLASLKEVAGAKPIFGIGNGAFSGTGSNLIVSYNVKKKKSTNTTVKTQNLWVLVKGKTFFEISASKVTTAQEEALAKKMVLTFRH